jgi:hypothetical protein
MERFTFSRRASSTILLFFIFVFCHDLIEGQGFNLYESFGQGYLDHLSYHFTACHFEVRVWAVDILPAR